MRVNRELKLNLIKQRNLQIQVRDKINFKEIHICELKDREETLREENEKNSEKREETQRKETYCFDIYCSIFYQ